MSFKQKLGCLSWSLVTYWIWWRFLDCMIEMVEEKANVLEIIFCYTKTTILSKNQCIVCKKNVAQPSINEWIKKEIWLKWFSWFIFIKRDLVRMRWIIILRQKSIECYGDEKIKMRITSFDQYIWVELRKIFIDHCW